MIIRRRPLRIGACLSLTGRHHRFGTQGARGLEAWCALDGDAELIVEDDGSDPGQLTARLRRMASRCDLLLGPYSTQLVRAAGRFLAETDHLLWNHGGSGDDVEAAHPGRIVSVLTPASRYAEPFFLRTAVGTVRAPVWIVEGRGSFGRQVAAGADLLARRLGLETVRIGPGGSLPEQDGPRTWDLFSAGSFEEDVAMVARAQALARPPRTICAVAAGVRAFGAAAASTTGVYGIAQWFPGCSVDPDLGPKEVDFLAAFSKLAGGLPDYPAVQAAAAAVLAAHCARAAGGVEPDALWRTAAGLDTSTLFGRFRIDPVTGVQVKHETVLVSWTPNGPMPAP